MITVLKSVKKDGLKMVNCSKKYHPKHLNFTLQLMEVMKLVLAVFIEIMKKIGVNGQNSPVITILF